MSRRRGVFPGSFSPPTVAHLEIARTALQRYRLDTVVFVLSRRTLGKPETGSPTVHQRVEVLQNLALRYSWIEAEITEHSLLSDIATGYHVLILGADKYHQIQELQWYEERIDRRDEALARLPQLAVAPRGDLEIPGAVRLDLDPAYSAISSTGVREEGRAEWMLPEAKQSRLWSGTPTDS